ILRNNNYGLNYGNFQGINILGNTIFSNTLNAIVGQASGLIDGNTIYSNVGANGGSVSVGGRLGLLVTVSNNLLYSNASGIILNTDSLATDNTVRDCTDTNGAFGLRAIGNNVTISNNIVYNDRVGIAGGTAVTANRVFANSQRGIETDAP